MLRIKKRATQKETELSVFKKARRQTPPWGCKTQACPDLTPQKKRRRPADTGNTCRRHERF